MGEIQQVVDQQPVVGLHMDKPAGMHPVGMIEPGQFRNRVFIGTGGIAGPDPDHAVFFADRKRPDAGPGRYPALSRHRDAGACRIEFETVIAALYGIAGDLAERQWQMTVTTAVFQRNGGARTVPPQHHGIAQDRLGQWRAGRKVVCPARGIPGVSQECHSPVLRLSR